MICFPSAGDEVAGFWTKIFPKLGYVLVMLMLGQGAFRPFETQLVLN